LYLSLAKLERKNKQVKFDVFLFLNISHLQYLNNRNQKYLLAFGANLKKLRQAKKLSREALAAEANIEAKQIYRIETGEHSSTISTVVAIAKALGLHPKKMFEFDD
jgi:DNA-binding XRE family transcriptional regulator